MIDHANKQFLQRSFMMKLLFPARKTGKKSVFSKIKTQLENFFYHRSMGKSIPDAWQVAKKTF
jgi:hypothetical protein